MIDIQLSKFSWSKWSIEGVKIYSVGYFYYQGEFYTGETLGGFIYKQFERQPDLSSLLRELQGSFSIVIQKDSLCILISDIIRSYPLLYALHENAVYIYDDINRLINNNQTIVVDPGKLKQYLSTFISYEQNTVFEDLFGLQSAEIVQVDIHRQSIQRSRYYEYTINDSTPSDPIDLKVYSRELEMLLLRVFQRVIDSSSHVNNWVIPLSGGHDSRLIAYFFHRLGAKNVVCFSYGRKGSLQAEISKKVAEQFGFRWHFIEYTKEYLDSIKSSSLISDYIGYSFNGVSTVDMQNFIPMLALVERGIVVEGDIFVPGHALDFIAGSHLFTPSEDLAQDRMLAIREMWGSDNWGDFDLIPEQITSALDSNEYSLSQISERFGWQERQSKYIVNSVRAYDFFGFEWRLPYWDKEVVDFFTKIPAHNHRDRSFFFECEKYIYRDLNKHVPFDSEKTSRNIPDTMRWIFNKLRRVFLSPFGYYTPILQDEGLNLLFKSSSKKVYDILQNVPRTVMTHSLLQSLSENIRELYVNKIVSLIILSKLYNKNEGDDKRFF